MQLVRTDNFKRSYKNLPKFVQKKADRILRFLVADLRHPSIRAKKIQGPKMFGKEEWTNFTGLPSR